MNNTFWFGYIRSADAMSRMRFKDYEDHLVAVAMGTFQKPVINSWGYKKK